MPKPKFIKMEWDKYKRMIVAKIAEDGFDANSSEAKDQIEVMRRSFYVGTFSALEMFREVLRSINMGDLKAADLQMRDMLEELREVQREALTDLSMGPRKN